MNEYLILRPVYVKKKNIYHNYLIKNDISKIILNFTDINSVYLFVTRIQKMMYYQVQFFKR